MSLSDIAGESTGLSPHDRLMEAVGKAYLGDHPTAFVGPPIAAILVDHVLFGVFLHQLITWMCSSKPARWFTRIIVALISLATMATTGFAFYFLWDNVAVNFAQYRVWVEAGKISWYGFIPVFMSIPSQIFYTERAYTLLDRKLWVWFLVMPFTAASFGGAISAKVTGYKAEAIVQTRRVIGYNICLAGTLIADLLVTGVILYCLIRAKTGAGDKDRLVNRLLKMTIENQLPPTILAIAFMIMYSVIPTSPVNAIHYTWTKCYVISLLATLNTQQEIVKQLNPVTTMPSMYERETDSRDVSNTLEISVHPVSYQDPDCVYDSRSPSPKPHLQSFDQWGATTKQE